MSNTNKITSNKEGCGRHFLQDYCDCQPLSTVLSKKQEKLDSKSKNSLKDIKSTDKKCKCQCHSWIDMPYMIKSCDHCTDKPQEDWEKELKLYLTSAGDRRRTISFIKSLFLSREREVAQDILGMIGERMAPEEYFGDPVRKIVNKMLEELRTAISSKYKVKEGK